MSQFAPFSTLRSPARLQDFEPLSPAERVVLRAAASGGIAKVGYRRPQGAAPEVSLRGEFVAFLLRGGVPDAPVASRQLQVMGAWVTGRVDLSGALSTTSLWLFRCSLGSAPVFDDFRLHGSLSFADCALPGLQAERCRIDGDLALSAGCQVTRELVLNHSRIGRHLNAERLHALGGLAAEGIEVAGDVRLDGQVEAVGEVRFTGARIGGSFRATGARLSANLDDNGTRGVALDLDRIRVGGDLLLDAGFTAAGTVRGVQARVRGDLDASGAGFDLVGDASWGEHGSALRLDRARIDGALILRDLQGPLQGASLLDARVGALTDDASTWGQHHVLDGFAYTRFGPGAPTDASARLSWLGRQRKAHVDDDFRPDPWRRLLRALRRGDHAESAAAVAVGREQHLRRIGRIGAASPAALRWLARLTHAAWGLAAGYGHRPWRLLGAALTLWLAFGSVYWLAAARGGLAPDPYAPGCRTACESGLPATQAYGYSFEVLMPLATLAPTGRGPAGLGKLLPAIDSGAASPAIQCLVWLEAACGWALGLAALTGWLGWSDRDRDLR